MNMTLTLKLLNHMATHHPDDDALVDAEHSISFKKLRTLVERTSLKLFDERDAIYGHHIQNNALRQIICLCSNLISVGTPLNIPVSISNEGLSATLKAGHVQVLYTDLMDKLWETANVFGPTISLVTPIDLFQHKIWKVKFRGEQSGVQIDDEDTKYRYRQWQESQPVQPHSNR